MTAAFICTPLTTICAGGVCIKVFTEADDAFENAVERIMGGGVRVVRAGEANMDKTMTLRRVVRTGVSPMNPLVKWAQLECGHDIFLGRKPRVGSHRPCEECRHKLRKAVESK